MSDSSTRPGEIARIREIAEGDPKWIEALTLLAVLNDRSEQTRNWQRGTDEWRANHDRNDTIMFTEIKAEIANMKASGVSISSGVENYKDKLSQAKGIRNFVVGSVLLIGTTYGAIKGIGEIVAWMASTGKHP